MKSTFKIGIFFRLVAIVAVFALSAWMWLNENTEPAGTMAAEKTITRLNDDMCGPYSQSRLNIEPAFMYFGCEVSAGHSNSVRIWLYEDAGAARTEFEERREGYPIQSFHGYPTASYEKQDFMVPGGLQQVMVWQAKHMLILVTAFDDTHFHSARDPHDLSEALYTIAREEGLLAQ
jgi:hypothetical protein